MKIDKIVVSVFTKDEKVIRVSVDSIIIYLLSALIIAPYAFIGVSKLTSKREDRIVQSNIESSSKAFAQVSTKVTTPVVAVKQEVKVAASSVNKSFRFKHSDLKVSNTNNSLDVNFILSKKMPDTILATGSIAVEVLDENGKVVGASLPSNFKFQTARVSKFNIKIPKDASAKMLKVKIIEEGVESSSVMNF